MARIGCLLIAIQMLACGAAKSEEARPEETSFERHIRPILKANCFQCHGEEGKREGGLDLRLRRLIVTGGDSGAALIPGDAEASVLLDRVRGGEMPPVDKKLSAAEVALLTRWVAEGAKTVRPEPEQIGEGPVFTEEERNFWSFQPITRPKLPVVRDVAAARTPIDRFVLAKLEDAGLNLSPDADRRTLVRRVYFDLLGLPPPVEEIDRFVNDDSPDAYERLLDRLLASP